jgi:hypothetical protein
MVLLSNIMGLEVPESQEKYGFGVECALIAVLLREKSETFS